MPYLLMALSWAVFYTIHSALAATKLKRILKAKWPNFYKNYRLLYSLLSLVLFFLLLVQASLLPPQLLFPPIQILSHLGYLVATLGVIVLLRSIREISVRKFLIESEPDTNDLIIQGIYSKVRHPLYLGLLLIFGGYFIVSGTLGAGIHLACLMVYLPFGIYFEEQNLLEFFGEKYREYQMKVPAFFPRLFK
ncbi:methyltransferase family protein [Algoriphagus sp. oki45]|uniref:methyltransferase family protein n=1 Tax=Algoriphagus sp. oki45 TaxID=3067294 RepID=UPI0030C67A36